MSLVSAARNHAGWVLVGLLGALAAALILTATTLGVGVGYDSYFYLTSAENLLDGVGLGRLGPDGSLIPLVHFPPLYPLGLAGLAGVLQTEVAAVARGLAAALMAANTIVFALLIRRASGSVGWTAVGGLTLLASPVVVGQHLWAMSEPLFFLLLLGALGALAIYLARGSVRWLLLSAACGGLAYLTRYVGLAVIAGGLLALLVLDLGAPRRRWKNGALYLGTAALLVVPWQLRNLWLRGNVSNRQLRLHPIPLERMKQAGTTLAEWLPLPLLPLEVRLALVVLTLSGLGIWGLRRLRRARRSSDRGWLEGLLGTAGFFALAYVGLLTLSLLLFDASIRLDERILSPLYLIVLLSAVTALALWSRGRWRTVVSGVAVALLILLMAGESLQRARAARANGLGFHSRAWRESQLVKAVAGLPEDTLLYSNESIPLNYLTGRSVYPVPERIDPVLAAERAGFRDQLITMRGRLRRKDGALVLFHLQSLRVEMPALELLTKGMYMSGRFEDGALYRPVE